MTNNINTFASIAFIAALGLLGFSAYQHSLPLWLSYSENATSDTPSTQRVTSNPVLKESLPANNLVEQLSRWHLFGLVTAKKKFVQRPKATVEKRPQTKLNLTIKGIINADEAQNGWAIISNASGKEDHFKVGDKIFNLAELDEIYTDHIILTHNGRQEELRILRKPVTLEKVIEKKKLTSNNDHSIIEKDDEDNKVLYAFQNGIFDQYLSTIEYEETFDDKDEEFRGYQLIARDSSGVQLLRSFQLAPNDIVTHVNGMKLTLDSDEESIAKNIGEHKLTRLTIVRNGKTINVNIPIPL